MNVLKTAAVALLVTAALAACSSHRSSRYDDSDRRSSASQVQGRCSACDAGRNGSTTWCDAHRTGWCQGEPTQCRTCWENRVGASGSTYGR